MGEDVKESFFKMYEGTLEWVGWYRINYDNKCRNFAHKDESKALFSVKKRLFIFDEKLRGGYSDCGNIYKFLMKGELL